MTGERIPREDIVEIVYRTLAAPNLGNERYHTTDLVPEEPGGFDLEHDEWFIPVHFESS